MLRELSLPIEVRPASIDESPRKGETPAAYVARIAAEKMEAVVAGLSGERRPYAGVLVADTTVTLEGRIFEKPRNDDESLEMITALAGREHEVKSSYLVSCTDPKISRSRVVSTKVKIRAATPEELLAYVQTGEGRDKAGAYAIQGLGAFLVESIVGSHSNVVGLPLCELIVDLKAMGLLEKFP